MPKANSDPICVRIVLAQPIRQAHQPSIGRGYRESDANFLRISPHFLVIVARGEPNDIFGLNVRVIIEGGLESFHHDVVDAPEISEVIKDHNPPG
jgi:hypothetical protein